MSQAASESDRDSGEIPILGRRAALAPAPRAFFDRDRGAIASGAYAGPLPPIAMSVGLRDRIARRKRWVYAAIVTDEMWLSLAIVKTGYASTAFAFVYDRAGKRMLIDRTALGPGPSSFVSDDAHASGEVARFALGKTHLSLTRRGDALDLQVRMHGLEVEASIDERAGPPAVSAIAALGDGLWNATEKRALLGVTGTVSCGRRVMRLEGGTAGYDYTHGLLPRHTTWRWAFALGRTASGEPIGFNVVQGFLGEAECAAFHDGKVHPIAEPRFEFDVAQPLGPWRLVGDGIDLAFEPGAVHAQTTDLLLVRSRFLQPVGAFTGSLRLEGKDVRVAGLPGVVEDQDVVW